MLSYAFRVLNEQGYKKIATEEFQNTADLMAAILEKGITLQVKQGFKRDYVEHSESLQMIRGKIDLAESIKRQSMVKKQLVCTYDDFSLDTPMNRL